MIENNVKYYDNSSFNDTFIKVFNSIKDVKVLAADATAVDYSTSYVNAITVSDAKNLSVVYSPVAGTFIMTKLIITNSAETESTVTLAGGTGCVLNGTAAQAVAAGATKVVTLYYYDGKVIVE